MSSVDRYSGLWHRAISRRTFLGAAAAATGAVAAGGLQVPAVMAAQGPRPTVLPLPIPGGVSPIGIFVHHFPPVPVLGPGPINEPSQITDFNGLVGVCRVKGSGTGTDESTGMGSRLNYQVDNGFMTGLYVGEDGLEHHGTFAFV